MLGLAGMAAYAALIVLWGFPQFSGRETAQIYAFLGMATGTCLLCGFLSGVEWRAQAERDRP